MDDTNIDRETMGRLAKALAFIGSPQDPVVLNGWRADNRGMANARETPPVF